MRASVSSAGIMRASSRADFTALLSAVHRKLGKAVTAKNNGWRVNIFNLMKSVNLVQNTEFENGRGVETFVLVMRGGSPVLVGYHINSNDLNHLTKHSRDTRSPSILCQGLHTISGSLIVASAFWNSMVL